MAKKTTVTWVDDIDGTTTADETVTFAYDGVSYEIDLSSENVEEFRSSMQPWIEKARRLSGRRSPRRGTGQGSQSGQKAAEIREWARANGHEVSDRGRISAEIRDAYAAAH